VNQSSYIAAFIFIGFVVYVTVKGELPAYKAAILGSTSSTSTSAKTGS
jgi:hypothetical protein